MTGSQCAAAASPQSIAYVHRLDHEMGEVEIARYGLPVDDMRSIGKTYQDWRTSAKNTTACINALVHHGLRTSQLKGWLLTQLYDQADAGGHGIAIWLQPDQWPHAACFTSNMIHLLHHRSAGVLKATELLSYGLSLPQMIDLGLKVAGMPDETDFGKSAIAAAILESSGITKAQFHRWCLEQLYPHDSPGDMPNVRCKDCDRL